MERLSPVGVGYAHRRHPKFTHPEKRYQSLFIGLETGSVRLFRQFMKGKAYPFRPEQWPDVVLKGMEILNHHNWFPFCTWIIGLPGETDADVKESLNLLHALKHAKWCVVPTLFTPLEDSRLADKESVKLPRLTELQWEAWRTSRKRFSDDGSISTCGMSRRLARRTMSPSPTGAPPAPTRTSCNCLEWRGRGVPANAIQSHSPGVHLLCDDYT